MMEEREFIEFLQDHDVEIDINTDLFKVATELIQEYFDENVELRQASYDRKYR